MQDLGGRTAVVTGAASGIGRALAEAFLAEGMRVVLADVETGALEAAAAALGARGPVLAVRTDVSKAPEVEALAERACAELGRVDVVCNNAGVALSGPVWEYTLADWEWLLGVNLWGVIHGVRAFVPRLIAQGGGHVVNTASIAGLTTNPFMGAYNVSKHAVVTLSETLHKELGILGHPVRVSVLCPGFVQTGLLDAHRNRPAALADGAHRERPAELEEIARTAVAAGLPPARVAAAVVDAIRTDRFWVLTHPEFAPRVRERMEDILEGRNPGIGMTLG